jgi:phage terminase large subunit-like protein
MPPREAEALLHDWRFWARPNQLAPDGDWRVWLIRAGRGFGKTRSGAEWVYSRVKAGYRRIALVNDTAADTRDLMIEGPSGVMAVSPPWDKPTYEPSKRRVTWPNGAVAIAYAAESPDILRGPEHDTAWCDELAKWKNLRKRDTEGGTAWDNLAMGMRIGPSPRICVTTTPRPLPIIKALRSRSTTVETVGSSHDNRANLSPDWYREVIEPYEGTRLGRQEIYAELLDDVPGALWTLAQLDALRVEDHPPLQRVVIGVDPEASSGDGAAETGIIAAGVARVDGVLHGYVLGDASLRGSPHEWATAAVTAYRTHAADRIVPERNNGGDMVEYTLRTVAANVPVKPVWASRGKLTRAEPVAALYEQGRIHHVGSFPDLEDQLCTWLPGGTSPDRLDALVWAFTELFDLTEREEPPKSAKAPAPMRVADRLRGMGFG